MTRKTSIFISSFLFLLFIIQILTISVNVSAQPTALSWTSVDTGIIAAGQACATPSIAVDETTWVFATERGGAGTCGIFSGAVSATRFTSSTVDDESYGDGNGGVDVTVLPNGTLYAVVNDAGGTTAWRQFFSNNGGTTWIEHGTTLSAGNSDTAIHAFTNTQLAALKPTTSCINLHSTNFGATWNSDIIAAIQGGCNKIAAVSLTTGFITFENLDTISVYKTTDGGDSYIQLTDPQTLASSVTPSICAFDVNNIAVVWMVSPSNVRFSISSDGGTTWANSLVSTSANSLFAPACTMLDSNTVVLTWLDNTDKNLFYAFSNDGGALWTVGDIGVDATIGAGGNLRMAFDSVRGVVVVAYVEDVTFLQKVAYASIEGFGTVGCAVSTEDCISGRDPDTQFQDVRVSYETTPSIYVRELGDAQAKRQNFGNVTLFDESLTQLVSNQPCDDGTFGTDGWTYTPNDSKHRGLAVTTDEFVIVTCLTGKLSVSDFAVMKILSPSSLTAIRTTGSVGDVTPTRIDAFTRNLASMPTIQDTFRHVDPLNGQAGDFFSQGGALGMSTISPQSGLSTAVGNPGVSIFDATSDVNSLPLVSTGSISANAAVVNETQIWISDASAGHLYNWTVGGFVLQTSDSDYKITTRQDAAGIRLTKDEDFLLHWTGSTVRIGHTQNFTDVYTATLSSTIQGCDADILNNYLYCVTPTTVERLFIANDIPTVWGLNKTGLTASNNTTVIAAIGATFTDSATDSGVSTSPGVTSPGAEGGFVEDTDNFFGVPIQPIADDFGTSITQVKWLIGIFLVALTAVTLGAVTMSGVGLLIGVGVGVAWATAMGFFPIWLILFVMFLILLLIGKGIAGG